MKIAVVFANQTWVDPLIDLGKLRQVGTIWSAWNQWHQLLPHHTICHDMTRAKELIAGNFHHRTELFVPETVFNALNKPRGIKSYGGEFLHEIDQPEELIAMFLAASAADIVVLVGYDWKPSDSNDALVTYAAENRMRVIRDAIKDSPNVQWIIAAEAVPEQLKEFENVDHDTIENIISA